MDERGPRAGFIAKESIGAILRTTDQLIVGQLHARQQKRLKDELNHISDRFVAITDARVYDANGTRLCYEASFLLVSIQHILTVTPVAAVARYGDVVWRDAVLSSPLGEEELAAAHAGLRASIGG
jgi:hypothetical protein